MYCKVYDIDCAIYNMVPIKKTGIYVVKVFFSNNTLKFSIFCIFHDFHV